MITKQYAIVRNYTELIGVDLPLDRIMPPEVVVARHQRMITSEVDSFIAAATMPDYLDHICGTAWAVLRTFAVYGVSPAKFQLHYSPVVDATFYHYEPIKLEPPKLFTLLEIQQECRKHCADLAQPSKASVALRSLLSMVYQMIKAVNLSPAVYNAAFAVVVHSATTMFWTLYETQTELPGDYRPRRITENPEVARAFLVTNSRGEMVKSPSYVPPSMEQFV